MTVVEVVNASEAAPTSETTSTSEATIDQRDADIAITTVTSTMAPLQLTAASETTTGLIPGTTTWTFSDATEVGYFDTALNDAIASASITVPSEFISSLAYQPKLLQSQVSSNMPDWMAPAPSDLQDDLNDLAPSSASIIPRAPTGMFMPRAPIENFSPSTTHPSVAETFMPRAPADTFSPSTTNMIVATLTNTTLYGTGSATLPNEGSTLFTLETVVSVTAQTVRSTPTTIAVVTPNGEGNLYTTSVVTNNNIDVNAASTLFVPKWQITASLMVATGTMALAFML